MGEKVSEEDISKNEGYEVSEKEASFDGAEREKSRGQNAGVRGKTPPKQKKGDKQSSEENTKKHKKKNSATKRKEGAGELGKNAKRDEEVRAAKQKEVDEKSAKKQEKIGEQKPSWRQKKAGEKEAKKRDKDENQLAVKRKKGNDTPTKKKAKTDAKMKKLTPVKGKPTVAKKKSEPKDAAATAAATWCCNVDPSTVTYRGPAPDIGKGWTVVHRLRTSGTMEGFEDKYWFAPKTGELFRSRAAILRFMEKKKDAKLAKKQKSKGEKRPSIEREKTNNKIVKETKKQEKNPPTKQRKGDNKPPKKKKKDDKKKSISKKDKPTIAKKKTKAKSDAGAGTVTYRGPAPEVGKGWTVERRLRTRGTMEGFEDSYWFSPKSERMFRSRAAIQRFVKELGSRSSKKAEDEAWDSLKKKGGA
mmetsp:Transcript_57245/g.170708  ORF Transcript_57245/g.170708 Transcript_57245/m.170708 type:complete len:416 (-) Transcript_57245:1030-2277(-)